ncbi:MAG: hypothetical protein ACE5HI_08840 [bacterium]
MHWDIVPRKYVVPVVVKAEEVESEDSKEGEKEVLCHTVILAPLTRGGQFVKLQSSKSKARLAR